MFEFRFVLLGYFQLCLGYDNLAYYKKAYQLHPYYGNYYPASAAVNGNKNPVPSQYHQCSLSDNNARTEALWRVHLGGIYSIHNVVIYYRTDNRNWDGAYPGRFAGFSLYVSNTTQKEDAYLCFHEIQNATNSPPPVMTVDCVVHGRYVIIYNERRQDVTYPDYYSNNAHLDLCEVEVYGCSNYGYYGKYCNITCPSNCQEQRCDIVNGTCLGCVDGFKGKTCETECTDNTYGPQCNVSCGNCLNGMTCSNVNGTCLTGCDPGWKGDTCDIECDIGHFGLDCTENCSINCLNDTCHHIKGHCISGCKAGWDGLHCNQECDGRKYGQDCSISCGDCLGFTQCHHINGSCPGGCDKGFYGYMCTEVCNETFYGEDCKLNCSSECVNSTCDSKTGACFPFVQKKESLNDRPNIVVIVSSISAVCLCLLILLFVLLFLRSRRKKNQSAEKPQHHKQMIKDDMKQQHKRLVPTDTRSPKPPKAIYHAPAYENITIEEDTDLDEEIMEDVYSNSCVRQSAVSDIPVELLQTIVDERLKEGDTVFKDEYTGLPHGEISSCDIGKQADNIKRNRFKTTFPYDHSRIVLKSMDGFSNDYINANYINGKDKNGEYIAAQGPKPNTIVDFWRMIWQDNVSQIVMLTNLTEGIKVKCIQYWPDKGDDVTVGPYKLTLTDQKVYAYYIVRNINLLHTGLQKVHRVTQYHYTAWPDHGTPDPLCLVVFHNHVMISEDRSITSPVVVHCSAGIGRTGTYIALDALYKMGQSTGKVNIAEYVKRMRLDRMNMVQTPEQYITIFLSLCEAFKIGIEPIKLADFVTYADELQNDDTVLQSQFQNVIKIKPIYKDTDYKLAFESVSESGTKEILPLDQYCLHLTSSVHNRGSYINAILVPSFKNKNYFIITPYPTKDTVIDFLRLLTDHRSTSVVVVDPVHDIKTQSSVWLPRESEIKEIEPFCIQCLSTDEGQDKVKQHHLEIDTTEISKIPHSVSVIEPRTVTSGSLDTAVIRAIVSCLLKSSPMGPVTVMSKDGATVCGIVCAVYNVLQQISLDSVIDIPTIVRQLQVRRPELCSTMYEYREIYEAVKEHILFNSDNMYYN